MLTSADVALSAGSIRQKNVKNILLKNLLDACMGAITWYFIGYGFAYDPRGESEANGPRHPESTPRPLRPFTRSGHSASTGRRRPALVAKLDRVPGQNAVLSVPEGSGSP